MEESGAKDSDGNDGKEPDKEPGKEPKKPTGGDNKDGDKDDDGDGSSSGDSSSSSDDSSSSGYSTWSDSSLERKRKQKKRNKRGKTKKKKKKRKPIVFRLTPYQRTGTHILDYDDKAERAIYDKAVEPLYSKTEEKFNLEAEEIQNLNNHIKDRMNKCSMKINMIGAFQDDQGNWEWHDLLEEFLGLTVQEVRTYAKTLVGRSPGKPKRI